MRPLGQRIISLCDLLRLPNGERYILLPSLREWMTKLFSTLKPDGSRQYTESLLFLPRRNSKTLTCGALVVALLVLPDPEDGVARIVSASVDRQSASHVFEAACDFVRQDQTLKKKIRIIRSRKMLENRETGATYKALSADAFRQFGSSPTVVIVDEPHAMAKPDMVGVLRSAMVNRRNPLTIVISTAGRSRNSWFYEYYRLAKQVAADPSTDPSFLPVLFEAPESADPFSEETWRQCNPGYGISIKPANLRALADKAKLSPTALLEFKQYHLNQWVDANQEWLPSDVIDACKGDIDPATLKGKPCWCGLDLASIKDLCAFSMVFPLENGRVAVLCKFWCPDEGARRREDRDRQIPYFTWAKQGLITLTPGNVADYGRIRGDINALKSEYAIQEIAVDRWNATQLTTQLTGDGFTCVAFGMGFASMAGPTRELEKLSLSSKLIHFGNPVLTAMLRNVVVEMDAAGNLKPSKQRSTQKIDGVTATVMGLGRSMAAPAPSPTLTGPNGGLLLI